MAFYRRLRELVSFIHEGKVRITRSDEKRPDDTKRIGRKFNFDDE